MTRQRGLCVIATDPHAGGPLQTAGGLLGTLVCRRRRPDLLWAARCEFQTASACIFSEMVYICFLVLIWY